MGTHPIFESDFDCLTDEMIRRLAFTLQPIRKISSTPKCPRDFREGFSIVHGRHMLPYWQDKNNKQVKIHVTNEGNQIEIPKYTIRPFMMINTQGKQPVSEEAALWT